MTSTSPPSARAKPQAETFSADRRVHRDIELSVVIPAHNESPVIDVLAARLDEVLARIGVAYEVAIVDDASSDDTWQAIGEATRRYPHLIGITLSRNFGHQSALLAGLSRARGRAVLHPRARRRRSSFAPPTTIVATASACSPSTTTPPSRAPCRRRTIASWSTPGQ